MKLSLICAAVAALSAGAGAGGVARADRWDSTGWVKLGEREVNGRIDHDRIVDFKYKNLPGGGRAKIQGWAK